MRKQTCLFVTSVSFLLAVVLGCESQGDRKIKLAGSQEGEGPGSQTAASILRVAPDEQHSVAILFFRNETGDHNLDWLRRGLTDMLVAELSQSRYLDVITTRRLIELAERMGKTPEDLTDLSVAAVVANAGRVQTLISGRFYREGDSLRIDVDLREVGTGQVLRSESVSGPGLERIFLMVDDLSQRVRADLRGDLEPPRGEGVRLAEMTTSIEAFRCYSRALENMDKLLYVEADSCFRQAIEYDSTFAPAYLRLAMTSRRTGHYEEAAKAIRQARRYAHKMSTYDELYLRLLECDLTGDVEQALSTMQELLQLAPNDVETRMWNANLLLACDFYDRALEEYERILELDPSRKLVYNQLGYVYAHLGDFGTALDYIETYESLAPDEPNPYDSKGEILMMAGRFKEAATALKLALSKWPSFYQSAVRLASVYAELDNLDQALVYSNRAIAHAPSARVKSGLYTQQAQLFWRFGEIEKAEQALRLAAEVAPMTSYHVLIGGEMYKSLGDTAAANRLYHSFLQRLPEMTRDRSLDVMAVMELLLVCMESGLPSEEVIPVVQTFAAANQPPMMEALFGLYLTVLHLRAGDYDKAAEFSKAPEPKFFDILVQSPGEERSFVWKYIGESLRLAPPESDFDAGFCQPMIHAARAAGRKDLEAIARFFRAQYFGKIGRTTDLEAEYRDLGAALEDKWQVIGPFENRAGFRRHFPPEKGIDLDATYEADGRQLSWQSAADGAYEGYVDLRSLLQPSPWAVGYALVYVVSPEERVAQLRIAADETCKLWLNDELVWQVFRSKATPLDRDVVTVRLRKGQNKLLIKVTNTVADWGFYLRVTDEKGNGFADLRFRSPKEDRSRYAALGDPGHGSRER